MDTLNSMLKKERLVVVVVCLLLFLNKGCNVLSHKNIKELQTNQYEKKLDKITEKSFNKSIHYKI